MWWLIVAYLIGAVIMAWGLHKEFFDVWDDSDDSGDLVMYGLFVVAWPMVVPIAIVLGIFYLVGKGLNWLFSR